MPPAACDQLEVLALGDVRRSPGTSCARRGARTRSCRASRGRLPTSYHRFTATIGARSSWDRITRRPFGELMALDRDVRQGVGLRGASGSGGRLPRADAAFRGLAGFVPGLDDPRSRSQPKDRYGTRSTGRRWRPRPGRRKPAGGKDPQHVAVPEEQGVAARLGGKASRYDPIGPALTCRLSRPRATDRPDRPARKVSPISAVRRPSSAP